MKNVLHRLASCTKLDYEVKTEIRVYTVGGNYNVMERSTCITSACRENELLRIHKVNTDLPTHRNNMYSSCII